MFLPVYLVCCMGWLLCENRLVLFIMYVNIFFQFCGGGVCRFSVGLGLCL